MDLIGSPKDAEGRGSIGDERNFRPGRDDGINRRLETGRGEAEVRLENSDWKIMETYPGQGRWWLSGVSCVCVTGCVLTLKVVEVFLQGCSGQDVC